MSSALDHTALDARRSRAHARSPLFDAADQDRVRAELATFFGPRAEVYLETYEKLRAGAGRRTWSWPAFFGAFTWFFYRKMYLIGALMVFLPIVFGYLFGTIGAGISIIFAAGAKRWYVQTALARIAQADQLGLTGFKRSDYLRRAGGVSLTGGLFAGFVYVSILILLIAAFAVRRHSGH